MPQFPDPCSPDPPPELTSETAAEFLDHLLASPPCSDTKRELRRLGLIIDLSKDCGRGDGLTLAQQFGAELLGSDSLTAQDASLLNYFLSNAWEAIRRLDRSGWDLHAWEQPEFERQIIHLRRAVRLGKESGIESLRLCQMFTNLGNLMNHCGRVVEAVASWDAALRLDPGFGMALGNRGYGLFSYAQLYPRKTSSSLNHNKLHVFCFFCFKRLFDL